MSSVILERRPLGFPWVTWDPFLFCAYHHDAYPEGNEQMGPDPRLLHGRNLGMDFTIKDGFRMYHGGVVPGFPQHPHRGFETVTLVREGYCDHTDSMGAHARFGEGDVQWMTAGTGIVHAEMFPLVHPDKPNPLELFQVWLNLPAKDKHVPPYFTMLWSDTIPRHRFEHEGAVTEVMTVTGALAGDQRLPKPPPNSWAARAEAAVSIWTIRMDPGARWSLPAVQPGLNRALYFYNGERCSVGGHVQNPGVALRLQSDAEVRLENGNAVAELLLLQGRPIGEPVAQHGPFVMNTTAEIYQAFADYRATRFGGWPWPKDDPTHQRSSGRFAVHADGRREEPG